MRQELYDVVILARQRADKLDKVMNDWREEIDKIEVALAGLDEKFVGARIDPTNTSIDLSYSGDAELLHSIFLMLGKIGYRAGTRPGDLPQTSFNTYFTKEGVKLRIWLAFTSTVCKRVKIGEEMVKQDIYAISCE